MSRTILQVVGKARAGKSEVCKHLSDEYGFTTIHVSNIIRTFANAEGIALGLRGDYLPVHKMMKDKLGKEIIANTILQTIGSKICVDGIRVPNDVNRLRTVGSMVIALHCSTKVRFERAQQLQNLIDPSCMEDFKKADATDAYNPDPEQQNTLRVMQGADYHIDSSQPLVAVLEEVDSIVIPMLDTLCK